jgi:hypothetical protein
VTLPVILLCSIALTSGAIAGGDSGSSDAGAPAASKAAGAAPAAGFAAERRGGHHCRHEGARGTRSADAISY